MEKSVSIEVVYPFWKVLSMFFILFLSKKQILFEPTQGDLEKNIGKILSHIFYIIPL